MDDPGLALPIWRTVVAGYREGIGALLRDGTMFRYFIYASALILVLAAGQLYVGMGQASMSGAAALLTGLLISAAYALCVSPLIAALHRKLLLGEMPRGFYLAAMFQATELRLAVATMAVNGLFFVAELATYPIIYFIYGLNPLIEADVAAAYSAQPTMAFIVLLLSCAGSGFAALISTRLAFAFPAISTNAPNASLRQSYADTRGCTWRLFFIFLLILFFPFVAFVIAAGGASVLFITGTPEALAAPENAAELMMLSPPFLVLYALAFLLMMAIVVIIGAAAACAYEIRVNRGMSGVVEVFA